MSSPAKKLVKPTSSSPATAAKLTKNSSTSKLSSASSSSSSSSSVKTTINNNQWLCNTCNTDNELNARVCSLCQTPNPLSNGTHIVTSNAAADELSEKLSKQHPQGKEIGRKTIVETIIKKLPDGSTVTTTKTRTTIQMQVPGGSKPAVAAAAARPVATTKPKSGAVAPAPSTSPAPTSSTEDETKTSSPSPTKPATTTTTVKPAAATTTKPAAAARPAAAATKPSPTLTKSPSGAKLTSTPSKPAAVKVSSPSPAPASSSSSSSSSSATPSSPPPAASPSPSPSPPAVDGDADDGPAEDAKVQPPWKCTTAGCKKTNPSDNLRCTVCAGLSPLVSKDALIASEPPPSNQLPILLKPTVYKGQIGQPRTCVEIKNDINNSDTSSSTTDPLILLDPYGTFTKESELQWGNMLESVKNNNNSKDNKFFDKDFPPDDTSLYGVAAVAKLNNNTSSSSSTKKVTPTKPKSGTSTTISSIDGKFNRYGKLEWRRICELTKEDSSHEWYYADYDCDGDPILNDEDIKQGILGDCWFLSALSIIANYDPKLIANLFLTCELNSSGAYQFKFCKNGEWKNIIIDDYLPCYLEKGSGVGKLSFSKSPTNALWVALIEKAYAKLHNGYANIESGNLYEALTELTGAPSERLELHKECLSRYGKFYKAACKGDKYLHEILWSQILLYYNSKFLLGASCGRKDISKVTYFTDVGLRNDHAYAILDVKIASNGIQFLKMRNPWGSESWTGDWSMNSKKWTPELRDELNYPFVTTSSSNTISYRNRKHEDKSHGIFWICFLDFLKYFRTIDICKYQNNWKNIRIKEKFILPKLPTPTKQPYINSWSHQYIYELIPSKPTWCFITFIQEDQRGIITNIPMNQYVYKNIGAYLIQNNNNNNNSDIIDVNNPSSYERCAELYPQSLRIQTLETLLSNISNKYILLPLSFAHAISKGNDTTFPYVMVIYSAHPIKIIRKNFSPYQPLLSNIIIQAMKLNCKKELNPYCTFYSYSYQGGVLLYVSNRDENQYTNISMDLSGSSGLYCSRGRNEFIINDIISPQSEKLLFIMISGKSEGGYGMRRKCFTKFLKDITGVPESKPPLANENDIHAPIKIIK